MPGDPTKALASMGIYVFSAPYLRDRLKTDAVETMSTHDFGQNILPAAIRTDETFAFPFVSGNTGASGYWRDVGTVDAYWAEPYAGKLNMYDEDWPIWTYQEQLPPAKFAFDDDERRGMAVDSLVSGGCLLTGAVVRHSILFSNVRVHSYSTIEDSVILPDVEIHRNCRLSRCVIDKGTVIPEGTVIGEDRAEDERRFYVSEGGIVLVTPDMMGQDKHEI